MAEAPDHSENRPSPDALLAAARKEGRGRLKIFLGAAPGVGKTYAMLEAAHAQKRDGVDVVVGIVETHGRRDTAALIGDLDALPRRVVPYRGRELGEFDLDAALARKPKLVLVDELAHTNAPGSRHPKRYQDVQELIGASIDVYTTLNVQHLESLNDVIAKITRIRVRETLPDEVFETADEVEIVDLTPQELIKRLREGKVYVEGQAQRAIAHFFQPGNITALRELALRRVAERVDEQMVDYMREHAISGPWPAGERLIACIGPDADALEVVRATRRLADQLHAPWTAVYVEMPGQHRLSQEARDRIAAALRLAEQLEGEATTIPARDLVQELLAYARNRNVTQIVIGYRPTGWFKRLLGRSLVGALVRHSGDIAIHVVPLSGERKRRLPLSFPIRLPADWRPYAWSAAFTGIAIIAGMVAEDLIAMPSPAPFLIVAVLLAAVRFGLGASLFASLLASAGYNFFFIEPRLTFTIYQPEEVVALGAFLITAIVVSSLTARIRDQLADARRRMRAQGALYDFSRKLATTVGLDDLLWAVSFQLASAVQGAALVLLPEKDDLRIAGSYPPEDMLDAADWTAARWAWQKGEPAGQQSQTLPNSPWRFEPLKASRGTIGVAAFRPLVAEPDERRFLHALIDQSAVAIERAQLDREIAEARVLAATEKLRHALLSSISHDLRTPLASILGAITSLRSYGTSYDDKTRTDLMTTIEEEAERLNRFVANLLDMTRLEAGVMVPNRDWVAIDDLLSSAAARAQRRLGARQLKIVTAQGLPLVKLDAVLMEQVLFNILDNAAKYSADGSTITLSARMDDGMVVIEIADSGLGIPVADLERVFDKFQRISGGDRQVAGTGLGLAVCKGIVEAHGGTIRAVSPGPDGVGTVIVIRLPADASPAIERAA